MALEEEEEGQAAMAELVLVEEEEGQAATVADIIAVSYQMRYDHLSFIKNYNLGGGYGSYYGGGLGYGGILPFPFLYGSSIYCDGYGSYGYGRRVYGGGWGSGPCYY